MPGYRVEYASSGRAKCNGPRPCFGTPIAKGEIRFGTWVTMQEHGSFKWRHWGCLTKSVFVNVSKELEGNIDELDGLEDLKPEDQSKIKKAFELQQVDPADIPSTAIAEEKPDGSPNENSPSVKKRKRAPSTKKKPKDDQEDNAGEKESKDEKPKKKRAPKKKKVEPVTDALGSDC